MARRVLLGRPQKELVMHVRGRLLAALVFAVSLSPACLSAGGDDCFALAPPITTGVDGSWEISQLAEDGSALDLSSTLFVRIESASQNADGGVPAMCSGSSGVSLVVTYLAGDDQFKDAAMSGTFYPSQAGAGTLALKLGALSVSAQVKGDGTVVSTTSSWHDDAGTRSALVILTRTAL
jgi:hypothetical protein